MQNLFKISQIATLQTFFLKMWYNRDIKKGWFCMSNFNGMVTPVVPSDAGKDFAVDTHVTFLVHGQPQTGVVTKQLKMPLSSKLTKRKNNHLMVHSNGVIVINYKQLKKI